MTHNKRTIALICLIAFSSILSLFNCCIYLTHLLGKFLEDSEIFLTEEASKTICFKPTNVYSMSLIVKEDNYYDLTKFIGDNPNIDIDTQEPLRGNSLLMYAIFNNKLNSAKALLENGANPNFVNENHETPLIYAIKKKNISAIRILADFGANPNFAPGGPDNSPYKWASNDISTFNLLMDSGLNLTDSIISRTILMTSENLDILHFLIFEKKINPAFSFKTIKEQYTYDTFVINCLQKIKEENFASDSFKEQLKQDILNYSKDYHHNE